ncbi:MAG: DNA-protecting protein DprA [Oscillospiraceae bacterium]|nr:DNA-protecting protein DprA [Oscillospiraceae bacterium]
MYWIWLSQLNLSPKARHAVVSQFGTAEAAFFSPKGSFETVPGLTAREAEELEERDLSGADAVWKACQKQKLRILPVTDPDYPEQLHQIDCPPAVLYVRGTLPEENRYPIISVIGTRNASPYGVRMAQQLSWQLARGGADVICLCNAQLDGAVARGASGSGRSCIGILGTPHECFRGCLPDETVLVSEYPPGMTARRHFFRERNRIAAGLSSGVVVVEAPENSGTRLFVREAVEQGKDIFAVPGNADAENSAGTLILLKEGAKLVTCGEDVLEEYLLRFPSLRSYEPPNLEQEPEEKEKTAPDSQNSEIPESVDRQKLPAGLTEDQQRILTVMGDQPVYVDDIADQTGLSTARVLAQLTVLEIKGCVRREAGRRFARIK